MELKSQAMPSAKVAEESWASADSFKKLSRLCHEFLKWDKFTVRSMKPRSILEWENEPASFILTRGNYETRVFSRCDGALSQVVKSSKQAGLRFIEETRPMSS